MPGEAPTTRQIPPTPHHAAGDCELRFTTGGDAEWFAQSAEYYVACPEPAEWDNDAAQSGTIGSGQETWMATTVVGPGRIQFRFKMSWVSGDGLAFYVDEGVVASWGQSDTWDPTGWFDIPSGTHTLKWKYVKYSGSTAGSAWIDAIQWTGGVPESGGGADWEQITYTYDPSGRRIAKLVSPPGGGDVDGVVTKYVVACPELAERDGDHCIAEYDGDDTLLRKFIHGPRVDEPRSASLRAGSFCMLESPPLGGIESAGGYAGTYYYHYDALGSVVALSDAAGDTVQVYEYDVYGQVAASDPNHPNRFLFTGREFDKETGLYYYRARYYNPTIGRFLQTDPIGYGDGMNMYRYCRNNPVSLRDPSGRYWMPPQIDPYRPPYVDILGEIGEMAGWIVDNIGPHADAASDLGGGTLAIMASVGYGMSGNAPLAVAAFDAGIMMIGVGLARIIATASGNDILDGVPSTAAAIVAWAFFGEDAGGLVQGLESVGISAPRVDIPGVGDGLSTLARMMGLMDGVRKMLGWEAGSEEGSGNADACAVPDSHNCSPYCPYNVTPGQECPVCGLCPVHCQYPWTGGYCTVLNQWAPGKGPSN